MIKTYVLDTNILLQTEGNVINGFADNVVVIPSMVLEEMDNQKNSAGEKGYAARECIRKITAIKDNNGELAYGISLDNGGIFEIETNSDMSYLPNGWKADKPDNIILGTVVYLDKAEKKKNNGNKVILISNDVSMQVKASIVGIEAQGYKNDQIDSENSYTGKETIYISDELLNILYKNKELKLSEIDFFNCDNEKVERLVNNCFYIVKNYSENASALTYYSEDSLKLIDKKDYENVSGISPMNAEQTFALVSLMRPVDEIPFTILKGCAGGGKTILSLAAGLEQMSHDMYDKIIITRSNTLSDEELGFLPGTLEDKMDPLLAPFYDNLRTILKLTGEDEEQIGYMLDDMLERKSIEIVSLAYIRGRSISNAFIIIDEGQNLSITQAKTIVTRCGIGSKIVIMGDPSQIDNPKLDKKNNGLNYLAEKFKGENLCQQIEFTESVRSNLASRAIELLG